jgi:cell division protein FtsA
VAEKVEYVAALEAGSTRTRYLIGVLEGQRLRLAGASLVKSEGWHKGRIADPRAVSASFERAILEGEKNAGVSVPSAVVGMGGATIEGLNNRFTYDMGRPRTIREEDTRYAVEQAMSVAMPADRMILQMAPQDFMVDGRTEFWNPLGATGSRLESFVHLVTTSCREHDCLVSAVHQAHLAVDETVFEPYAAAYAAVRPQERGEGVAVIDIGAHSTGMVVYFGEALMSSASLPVSGDHFTRDVAQGLCVTYEDAERLKTECGCAMVGLTADNSVIELPSPEGRAPREAPRLELNRILEARAGELFLYVRRELSKAGMDQGPLNSIVLVGGGALLPGMWEMAERVLNCQARTGLAEGIAEWPEEFKSPAWTAAAGLLMYAARLKLMSRGGGGRLGLWDRLFG